jgi:hypothetical protein
MNVTLNPMSAAGIRPASTTAGIVLLLLAILSGFGQFAAVQHLVVENNAVNERSRVVLQRLVVTSV